MKVKLTMTLLLMAVLRLFIYETEVHANADFSDTGNHWAAEAINWGINNDIINGYSDGTFKPNKNVSEAEFITMLLRAYKEEGTSNEQSKHWADNSYTKVNELNYPVNGSDDVEKRNAAVDRLSVAEIIVGANGANYIGAEAIHYLIGNNLSNGKTSKTIGGYEGLSLLTRAEAITFIQNLKSSGMTELRQRPEQLSDAGKLPSINEIYIIGEDHLDTNYDQAVYIDEQPAYMQKVNYKLSNGFANVEWTFKSDILVEDDNYRSIIEDEYFPRGINFDGEGNLFVNWSAPIGYGTVTAVSKDTGETIAQKRILISNKYFNLKNLIVKNGSIELHLFTDDRKVIEDPSWGTYEAFPNRDAIEFWDYSKSSVISTTAKLDRQQNIVYFSFTPFKQTNQVQNIQLQMGYVESIALSDLTIVVPKSEEL